MQAATPVDPSESLLLHVYLAQERYPEDVIAKRLYSGPIEKSTEAHRDAMKAILARIPADAGLDVISEHPGAQGCLVEAQVRARTTRQIIVLPLGFRQLPKGKQVNTVAVLGVQEKPLLLDKISFSVTDQERRNLRRGQHLYVFETPQGRLAVLNCHDYTHADLVAKLAEERIEILIVTTFNPAADLYAQYALADTHRLFCFVIVLNVGNFGGSGVFAPFRQIGKRSKPEQWERALSVGGQQFYAKGEGVARVDIDLPLGELRRARKIFSQPGNIDEKKSEFLRYDPIVPSEFWSTEEAEYKAALQRPARPIDLATEGYSRPAGRSKIRVGLAQLDFMDKNDYLENSYHFSLSPRAKPFCDSLKERLNEVKQKIRLQGEDLDFLVFPEVFLPLGIGPEMANFAHDCNTIVIGGVEYDEQSDAYNYGKESASGENRCRIWIPTGCGVHEKTYTKLTRSQYDARTKDGGFFELRKGKELLRFYHPDLGSFGVLICYDISHFDILWTLNRAGIEKPLDLLFIVANNPDGKLYKACCMADCHRFYQYIVLCNVAPFGHSGVFGPVRSQGERQTLLDAGMGGKAILLSDPIDLHALRKARDLPDVDLEKPIEQILFRKQPGTLRFRWEKPCEILRW